MEPVEISRNLKDLDRYLRQFKKCLQSAHFEKLIAKAVSCTLDLPFFSLDDEDPNRKYRLTWQSYVKTMAPAKNKADAIAQAYGLYLLIEASQKEGPKQLTQELEPIIRHYESLCSEPGIEKKDVYVLVVYTKLRKDTFECIKSYVSKGFPIILLELQIIAKLLETTQLVFPFKHLMLRRLFVGILKTVKNADTLSDFREQVEDVFLDWRKLFFACEKEAFTAVKSYEAMKKIGDLKISCDDIVGELEEDPLIKEYFKTIRTALTAELVKNCLLHQGLAFDPTSTFDDEEIVSPVPCPDFKGRGLRIIKAVERIHEQFPQK
ncbi:AlwI family type II restriction endonuclease [candidate division WOR-3 bacterium]|nr:AlwI family type II restriction endonuclease [candidate division WOR-3 bacterium]